MLRSATESRSLQPPLGLSESHFPNIGCSWASRTTHKEMQGSANYLENIMPCFAIVRGIAFATESFSCFSRLTYADFLFGSSIEIAVNKKRHSYRPHPHLASPRKFLDLFVNYNETNMFFVWVFRGTRNAGLRWVTLLTPAPPRRTQICGGACMIEWWSY